jgi:hypothetical protein
MRRFRLSVIGAALITLLGLSAWVLSPSAGVNLLIDLQATHATVTARWYYTPPSGYETSYVYVVEDEAAQSEVLRDSTSLKTATFTIGRTDSDKAYLFRVYVRIEDALGSSAYSDPFTERFIVPAKSPATLLAKRDMVTEPVIIPNIPEFEQPLGTLWLEFDTDFDIVTNQGLWSRDANGYEGGGHLSVWVREGSVHARIQSDSVSYQLSWPVVRSTRNQVAVNFGEDTGFELYVNGALASSDPYTGGTVGNNNDIVVAASKQNYRPDGSTPEWTNPFLGTVRVSEYYVGRYDFSGRWGLPPITPPLPVDSLNIEVAHIDHGEVVGGQTDYISVAFAPIANAATIRTLVDGQEQARKEAYLQVGAPAWVIESSNEGWRTYHPETGRSCFIPAGEWDHTGDACYSQEQKIAANERNNDCVGGRYWAKHNSETECNFVMKYTHKAHFNFTRGTRPVLRLEVLDENGVRLGFWERRAS